MFHLTRPTPGEIERDIEIASSLASLKAEFIAVQNGLTAQLPVHSLGLWSLNLSQIVEVLREPFLLGFAYKTTLHHVEEGEERFLLQFDPDSGAVWYEIACEHISRFAISC